MVRNRVFVPEKNRSEMVWNKKMVLECFGTKKHVSPNSKLIISAQFGCLQPENQEYQIFELQTLNLKILNNAVFAKFSRHQQQQSYIEKVIAHFGKTTEFANSCYKDYITNWR